MKRRIIAADSGGSELVEFEESPEEAAKRLEEFAYSVRHFSLSQDQVQFLQAVKAADKQARGT